MSTELLEAEAPTADQCEPRIRSRETNWGVVITETRSDRKTLATAETTFRLAGVLIILAGGALPVISTGFSGSSPMFAALGLAAASAFIGFSLYRYARTGFRSELRIDVRFGWVRIGTVNSEDDFTAKRSIQKHDVQSLFIDKTKSDLAKLCLRLKKGSRRVVLMVGPEDELIAPLQRTHEALYAPKMGKLRTRTKIDGDIIEVRPIRPRPRRICA